MNKLTNRKPFPAHRRVIAVELHNLLRIRRSLAKLRRELREGRSASEMVRTARGAMTRAMLLAYAEAAFMNGLRSVCAARRVLFRLENEASAADDPAHSVGVLVERKPGLRSHDE